MQGCARDLPLAGSMPIVDIRGEVRDGRIAGPDPTRDPSISILCLAGVARPKDRAADLVSCGKPAERLASRSQSSLAGLTMEQLRSRQLGRPKPRVDQMRLKPHAKDDLLLAIGPEMSFRRADAHPAT